MSNQEFCQSGKSNGKLHVAAFDFDGTLTTGDSLPYFLKFSSGAFKTAVILFCHIPQFILCLFKKLSRQEVKESLIKSFFYGMPIEDLKKEGALFVKGALKKMLKEKALLKLREHQLLGHVCILVSANLDVYLNTFAKEYGFNACLCSEVAFDEAGKVTGALQGKNCWGEEKVLRLKKLFGEDKNYILYAYGDSLGDQQLLHYADYPFFKSL